MDPQCRFTALTSPAAISLPSGEESCFLFGLVLGHVGESAADSNPDGVTYPSGVGARYPATLALSSVSNATLGDGDVAAAPVFFPRRRALPQLHLRWFASSVFLALLI